MHDLCENCAFIQSNLQEHIVHLVNSGIQTSNLLVVGPTALNHQATCTTQMRPEKVLNNNNLQVNEFATTKLGNIYLISSPTFYRDTCPVPVLSFGVEGLTLVCPLVLILHVVQVEVGPRHADVVIRRQLSVHLLPADLRDGAVESEG